MFFLFSTSLQPWAACWFTRAGRKWRSPRETVPSSPPFFTPLVSPSTQPPHSPPPTSSHLTSPCCHRRASLGSLGSEWPRRHLFLMSEVGNNPLGVVTHAHTHGLGGWVQTWWKPRAAPFSSICSPVASVSDDFSTDRNISGNYEAEFWPPRPPSIYPLGGHCMFKRLSFTLISH